MEFLEYAIVPMSLAGAAYLIFRFVSKKHKVVQKNNVVGGDMAGGNIIKTNVNTKDKK